MPFSSSPLSKMEASTRLWRRPAHSPLGKCFSFCRSEECVRQMEAFAFLRHRAKFLLEGGKGVEHAAHTLNWKLHSPLGTLYEVRDIYLESEYLTSGMAKRRMLSFATRWSASWTFILRGFQSEVVGLLNTARSSSEIHPPTAKITTMTTPIIGMSAKRWVVSASHFRTPFIAFCTTWGTT